MSEKTDDLLAKLLERSDLGPVEVAEGLRSGSVRFESDAVMDEFLGAGPIREDDALAHLLEAGLQGRVDEDRQRGRDEQAARERRAELARLVEEEKRS